MTEEQFVMISEPGKSPRRLVLEGVLEIGRECEGEVVSDDEVSRRHLKLVPSPTGLKVVDLGSSNGTTVNGVRITEPTPLKAGDVVRLGRTEVTVGAPPPPPPPPPVRPTAMPAAQPVSRSTSVPTAPRPGDAPAVAAASPAPAAPAGVRDTAVRSTSVPARPEPPAAPAPAAGRHHLHHGPPAGTAQPPVAVGAADAKAGPISTMKAMAGRSLRSVIRRPASAARAVVVAAFVFIVLTGALKTVTAQALELKSASLVFPMAVLLAASGVSRASQLADDVQRGFIDRLLLSSNHRLSVLTGSMIADLAVGAIVTVPLVVLALAFGLSFKTGIAGIVVIIVIAALWAAVYSGFWYGLAFRTGDPTHERLEYGVVIPLLLVAPSLVPRASMAGWLRAIAAVNPLTYLIDAIRTVQSDHLDGTVLVKAAIALVVVGMFSFVMAAAALRSRVSTTLGGRKPKPPKTKKPAADSEADMLRAALEAEREARQRAEQRLAAGGG